MGGNRARGVKGGVDRGGGNGDHVGRGTVIAGRGAGYRRGKARGVNFISVQGGVGGDCRVVVLKSEFKINWKRFKKSGNRENH